MPKDFSFSTRASSYDEGFEGRFSQRFYKLLLRTVELADGFNVLDVGCGTGALLQRMAMQNEINGFGIDPEANMIAEAAKKCPEMTIVQAKSEAIPFDGEAFDVVVACMAYHHFADKSGFASEASRLLKPGGALYIVDPRFPAPVRAALNGLFRLLKIAGEFCSPDEIERRFSAYGFVPGGVAVDGYAQSVKLLKKR